MGSLFKSPFYFLVCAIVGFLMWSFSFHSELNDRNYFKKQNTLLSADFKFENSYSLSSESEVAFSEDVLINELNPSEVALYQELKLEPSEWTALNSEEPFLTGPFENEYYETQLYRLNGADPNFLGTTPISTEVPLVDYEEETECDSSRLAIDRNLKKSAANSQSFGELIADRAEDSSLPKKCLIHIMRQFNLPDSTRGSCQNAEGPVKRGAVKPCISKAIVNATYNSLMDVSRCLDINPKNLVPKLSNESGFLINTFGAGLDAGIGQLTQIAIAETNKYYDAFMQEIEAKANAIPVPNLSCARILKNKSLISKVSDLPSKRCGLISAPANPLRNILYTAMLNRININSVSKRIDNNEIMEKFKKLNFENINKSTLIQAIALASYNAGPATVFNALNKYLDQRIANGLKLTSADFNFYSTQIETDLDGKEKKITAIARSYVMAPFIKVKDPNLKIKLKKTILLPEKIRSSYRLTFPEFLIYNQNNFDTAQKKIKKTYRTIGAPGYLGFLADKNKALRETFSETSEGPEYCSNSKFLKF